MKLCLWPNSDDHDPTARRRPAHWGKWGQRGNFPQEPVPRKHCRWCGDPITAPRRTSYCSAECADAMGLRIIWGRLRDVILERDKLCQLCGGASYKPNGPDVWYWGRTGGEIPCDRTLAWLARHGEGPAIRVEPEWHVDHIKPCSEGGTDDPANLRLLCGRCHKRVTREWHARRALTARLALCSAALQPRSNHGQQTEEQTNAGSGERRRQRARARGARPDPRPAD